MKILMDVNTIFDVMLRTGEPSEPAGQTLLAIEREYVDGYFSAASFDTLFYIAHKYFHNAKKAYKLVDAVLKNLKIVDVNEEDIILARNSNWTDFEDAIIAYCALRHGMDYIVTSNVRDFKDSPVKAVTPKEFVKVLVK